MKHGKFDHRKTFNYLERFIVKRELAICDLWGRVGCD